MSCSYESYIARVGRVVAMGGYRAMVGSPVAM